MSAEPLSLACQLEDLKQLDNKPYVKTQPHLFIKAFEKLPRHLTAFLHFLVILQKTDKRHSKGVVMSQTALGKRINRSRRTVIRNIQQLSEEGWIRITENKYSKGLYRNQLCIEVVCPETILQCIKNEVSDLLFLPNRKAVDKSTTVNSYVTPMTHDSDMRGTYINNNRNNYLDKR